MTQEYKNCQSCSMPLSKDPNGGGTNADGTKSKVYCSYCYADGKFRQPYMSVQDMQHFVKNKLKGMGFPGFIAGMFTKGIPKLKRWQNA